jgi:ABC-type transporter Mla subunit MlaD
MQDAQSLITQTKGVVGNADTVVTDLGGVVANAGGLVSENREPVKRTFVRLEKAATMLEQLAASGNSVITANEKKFNGIIADFRVTAQNLKVTSTYAEILTRALAQRPSSILWGGKPPAVPTREQILKSAGGM